MNPTPSSIPPSRDVVPRILFLLPPRNRPENLHLVGDLVGKLIKEEAGGKKGRKETEKGKEAGDSEEGKVRGQIGEHLVMPLPLYWG